MPVSSQNNSVQDYTIIRYLHDTSTTKPQGYDNITSDAYLNTSTSKHMISEILQHLLPGATECLAVSGYRADVSLSFLEWPLHLSTCRAPMQRQCTT